MKTLKKPDEVYREIQAMTPDDLKDRIVRALMTHIGPENRIQRRELVLAVFGMDPGTNLANSREDRMTLEAIYRIARQIEQGEAHALENAPKPPPLLPVIDHKIIGFITDYKRANDGVAPSIREIGAGVGILSTSQIDFYLDRLVKAGRIRRLPGSRGIVVIGGKWTPPGG